MKSLVIALMTAALIVPAAATAEGRHDGGRDSRGHVEQGLDRGGYRGGPGPGYGVPGGPGRYGPPPAFGRPDRFGGGEPRFNGRMAPQEFSPRGGGWRRGQFFPPADRGYVLNDYYRYHLRRPPPGYYWYRSGDDFILAALASGVIFEVVGADGY